MQRRDGRCPPGPVSPAEFWSRHVLRDMKLVIYSTGKKTRFAGEIQGKGGRESLSRHLVCNSIPQKGGVVYIFFV